MDSVIKQAGKGSRIEEVETNMYSEVWSQIEKIWENTPPELAQNKQHMDIMTAFCLGYNVASDTFKKPISMDLIKDIHIKTFEAQYLKDMFELARVLNYIFNTRNIYFEEIVDCKTYTSVFEILRRKTENYKEIEKYQRNITSELVKIGPNKFRQEFYRLVDKIGTKMIEDENIKKINEYNEEHSIVSKFFSKMKKPEKKFCKLSKKGIYMDDNKGKCYASFDVSKGNATILFYLIPMLMGEEITFEKEHKWFEFLRKFVPKEKEYLMNSKMFRQMIIGKFAKKNPQFNAIINRGIEYITWRVYEKITQYLEKHGFKIVFFQADEIVIEFAKELKDIKNEVQELRALYEKMKSDNVIFNFVKLEVFDLELIKNDKTKFFVKEYYDKSKTNHKVTFHNFKGETNDLLNIYIREAYKATSE